MNTKTLSHQSLALIHDYLHFIPSGNPAVADVQVPYYNNKRNGRRGELKALVGKGSPREILEEAKLLAFNKKFDLASAPSAAVTRFLVDNSIGIDCSGLAYYILDQESRSLGKGTLDRHIKFPFSKGFFSKIRAKMQPAKNADVETFAHDSNSKVVALRDIKPGDFLTMTGATDKIRNHVVVFHQIEYQNGIPTLIHYTHSIALPIDGEYGHGVRQGIITIVDMAKSIVEQQWNEGIMTNGAASDAEPLVARAKASRSEIRRLLWF